MPSWEKLQETGAKVGELLPGTWTLSEPPPSWLAREDPEASVHERIAVRADAKGRVA